MNRENVGPKFERASLIGQTISTIEFWENLAAAVWAWSMRPKDTRLGRHVALKFLPDNLSGDSKAMERFEREARAASLLNHPSICTIFEVEDHNGPSLHRHGKAGGGEPEAAHPGQGDDNR